MLLVFVRLELLELLVLGCQFIPSLLKFLDLLISLSLFVLDLDYKLVCFSQDWNQLFLFPIFLWRLLLLCHVFLHCIKS